MYKAKDPMDDINYKWQKEKDEEVSFALRTV